MARKGPNVFQVKLTTVSSTGAFRDVSSQVVTFSGFTVEAILELVHGFGKTYEESAPVGVNRIPAITISGPVDNDTTTGITGILGVATDIGAERVLRLNFASGTTGATGAAENVKMDVIVQSYGRVAARGALTQYSAVLQPTGAFSVSTTTGS